MNPKQPWVAMVQDVATARSLAESRELWGIVADADIPFNYRLEHVRAVVQMALVLAERVGADVDIVQAAAWLHDIAKGEKDHAALAASEAREILASTDFPSHKIDAVCDAIAKHAGLFLTVPIEPLEAAVLWDADKLTKLGATSLFQYLSVHWDKQRTTEMWVQHHSVWLENTGAGIAASMNTAPARDMAQKRIRFVEMFLGQLVAEYDGRR